MKHGFIEALAATPVTNASVLKELALPAAINRFISMGSNALAGDAAPSAPGNCVVEAVLDLMLSKDLWDRLLPAPALATRRLPRRVDV